MKKSKPSLKNSSLKENLRILKNNLSDEFNSKKHGFDSFKNKIIKKIVSEEPAILLTQEQVKEKYKEILSKNASIFNLHSFKDNVPLVSIIILNRNGLEHLKRLFKNFKENIQYPHYEIIVVDNASNDDSISFLVELEKFLPIKIIKNIENKSFSAANNEAARVAKGEYILLLNNDIEPTFGWLNQMMFSAMQSDEIGVIGAKLVYPYSPDSVYNINKSFKIQHSGIAFKEESGFIKPYNITKDHIFSNTDHSDVERAALTAAALLVKKDKYLEVGGLDENYNYGYEDVDLCLKLLKVGYKNIYCPKALLFHYEFGTQEKTKKREVKKRRLKNQKIFYQNWNRWLQKKVFSDKLNNVQLFSEYSLKVAFVVTESGTDASAGDYFTALELGEGLKTLGWNICFLTRRKSFKWWYVVEENVDIIISLLDSYNPQKIKSSKKSLIKIAWARNWFERWVSNPGFSDYDLVFGSSQTACNYLMEKSGHKALLMPIATNSARFHPDISPSHDYLSDYCFTGSYWNEPREIIEMLDPRRLPYTFKLYGENWDKIEKFKEYNQGFVEYSKMPEIYASTKIVIDDANRVTKGYGAVNSRVYDALASGALVLTNGEIGAEETFHGKLPVFKSKEELNNLIDYYLTNKNARLSKIKELQEFVLENHAYINRAQALKESLEQYFFKTKISIKIPAPSWKTVHEWGDYHLALGLKKEFEKKDCDVILQILPEWDSNDDADCDVVLVLRGLSKYKPKKQHFNIMWNISHPDKVEIEEYNQYDHVLIASQIWTDKLKEIIDVPVEKMLQCTDPELFNPEFSRDYDHDLLFVGNSRKVFRKIIKDLLPTNKDLSIYGTNWKNLVDKKYIKGKHIPNDELRKAYSSCKILLNDHWEDMKEKGFISNRLFDGFAAGAFIISDEVMGVSEVFRDALITYNNPEELENLISHYLKNEKDRKLLSEKGKKIVLNNHTFQKRVEHILQIINHQ
ncbi:MAG: glycosyltransferase [Methanobacteriaceae archaeon]|nr:glycosyltransferase [Methanobacteriaceae archaeon]MDO9627238.1 glycosyltransferase [Methanobacteriaceae archaeon]